MFAGRIECAIKLTRQLYPGLLENRKPCLLFQLMCRQFVEMVAELSENGSEENRTPNSSSPDGFVIDEAGENMEVEEGPRVTTQPPMAISEVGRREEAMQERVTLEKIIEFGKELYELEKTLRDPDGKYKQMLFVSVPSCTMEPGICGD